MMSTSNSFSYQTIHRNQKSKARACSNDFVRREPYYRAKPEQLVEFYRSLRNFNRLANAQKMKPRRNKYNDSGAWPLFLLVLILAFFNLNHDPEPVRGQQLEDKTAIKGWTEVNKMWPLESDEFFVSVEKGHNFIDVKLPQTIKSDFEVKLEYYYSYKKVRPIFGVVPCRTNIELTRDDNDEQNTWLHHQMTVKRGDCERRPELTYNVILHDADDLFAWRILELTTSKAEPNQEASSEPNQETSSEPNQETSSEPIRETSSEPSESSSIQNDVPQPSEESIKDVISEKQDVENKLEEAEKSSGDDHSETSLEEQNQEENQEAQHSPNRQRRASESTDKKKRNKKKKSNDRSTRSIQDHDIDLVCKPSSCDRSRVKSPRFTPLVKGLPKLPENSLDSGKKFYLDTQSKPLVLVHQSTEDFSTVNTCLDFELYMDAGTELELQVSDDSVPSKSRLLEIIEREAGDSAAGKWESFKRCISDYTPRLRPADPDSHTIKLTFSPKSRVAGDQVGILVDPERAVSLRKPYPLYEYLPNVQSSELADDMNKYWVLDKDGIEKATFTFDDNLAQESTSRSVGGKHILRVTDIDPRQESFDITSRWMQLRNLETLENPIFFSYTAEKAEWVKSVDFEYQRASDTSNDWISYKNLFVPKSARLNSQTNVTTAESSSDETSPPTSNEGSERPQSSLNKSPDWGKINLPIKVKGLNSDEFRIRVRHHLSDEARASAHSHQLNISALAFGDACAEHTYCANAGKCRPIGTATAECQCLKGYSGSRCEKIKPCEVVYGEQTGEQLCRSVGASCVQNIPVFRCEWPNDQFYKCKALYRNDEVSGEPVPLPPGEDEPGATESDINRLSRIVIILTVFLIALLLFAVVIVANLVKKLLDSRKRLRKAELEVHEMARRSQPSTSAPFGRLPGRHKPATVLSYNNQAFDAE